MIHTYMVNYYTSFKKMVSEQKLSGKILSLDDFECRLMVWFGFGGRTRSLSRWLDNFVDVDLIRVYRDGDNDGGWLVEVK